MGINKLHKGFGIFFDPTKITSGQRFFADLYQALSDRSIPLSELPSVILFNVSAPFKEFVKAKLRRQKIVLRIDGLYFDRLSTPFLATFKWPLRQLFLLGLKWIWAHDFFAFWANLINRNYGSFVRIIMADFIIYQSKFSQQVHSHYFPNKPYDIIVNGSAINIWKSCIREKAHDEEIRLVTIYDDWKPAKRIHDIVTFVQWVRETKKIPITLTILGYTGKIPNGIPKQIQNIIENSFYINTFPRFTSFTNTFREVLRDSDIYITFSYRDPCPNTVVESMAHGLPVIGIASGGIPDIVGDAGELLLMEDFKDGFFSSHRYDSDFPHIDFEQVLELILKVKHSYKKYLERVRQRFIDDLSIDLVAERYANKIESVSARSYDETPK